MKGRICAKKDKNLKKYIHKGDNLLEKLYKNKMIAKENLRELISKVINDAAKIKNKSLIFTCDKK